jgi:bacterioferritin-associated ferredoxin
MYVCVCNGVTDKQIIKAVEEGASTLQDLSEELNVATCCGRCASCAKKVMREAHFQNQSYEQPAAVHSVAFA